MLFTLWHGRLVGISLHCKRMNGWPKSFWERATSRSVLHGVVPIQFDAVQKNNSLVDNWSVVRWFFLHKCLIGTCLLKSQGYQWLRSPSSEFQTVNWFSICSHRLQKSSPHSEVFDHTSAGEYVYSSVGDHTIVGEHSTNFTSVFFFSLLDSEDPSAVYNQWCCKVGYPTLCYQGMRLWGCVTVLGWVCEVVWRCEGVWGWGWVCEDEGVSEDEDECEYEDGGWGCRDVCVWCEDEWLRGVGGWGYVTLCEGVWGCVRVCVGVYNSRLSWHICRKFFKVKPDSNLMWALIEQSVDETGRPMPNTYSTFLNLDSMYYSHAQFSSEFY